MLSKNYCYEYPNHNTLKNKANIKDYDKLEQWLARKTTARVTELRDMPLPNKLDSNYLKQIHQHIFQDGFEWAGVTRDVPFKFSDGSIANMPTMYKAGARYPFLHGDEIQNEFKKLDASLQSKNYLQGLSREEFTHEAAKLLAHLNYIHPFREGNGRAQRAFIEKIALQADHKIRFSVVTAERMVLASISAREQNNLEDMQHMFEDISNPPKTAALKEFLDAMARRGDMQEINERNVVFAKEGIVYQGSLFGIAKQGFVMTHQDRDIIVGSRDDLNEKQLKLRSGEAISFIKLTAEQQEQLQELEDAVKDASLALDDFKKQKSSDIKLYEKLANQASAARYDLDMFIANGYKPPAIDNPKQSATKSRGR